MVAAKIANMKRGDNQHAKEGVEISTCSQGQAADLLNVSRDSVSKAKKVLDKGSPSVVAAVETGELARDLEAILRPKAEQKRIETQGRPSKEKLSANLLAVSKIDTRKEAAKVAGVGERTYDAAAIRAGL